MGIAIAGTTYKIVSTAKDPLRLDCLVLDAHFVIRLAAWFYGPWKAGPPRRLPQQEQVVLVWLADLHAERTARRRPSLRVDPWLACIESSRRKGAFDPVAFDARFEAVEIVLGEWAQDAGRMRREAARARGTTRRSAIPESLMSHDGEQMHLRLITAMIDVLELRSAIVEAQACRDDAGRLGAFERYLQHIRDTRSTPFSSAIPLALDGIFAPANTTIAADAIFKPGHPDWTTPVGVVKMTSNVVFDLTLLERVRDGDLGRHDESPPAGTGLLTQDKALPALFALLETVAFNASATLEAVDVSALTTRTSPRVQEAAAEMLKAHSLARAGHALAPITIADLEDGLRQRLAREGARSHMPVSELLSLAEAARTADWER